MNAESFLTMPCHWDMAILNTILKYKNKKNICVKEMYGVSSRSPIGHGRAPSTIKPIEDKKIFNFRKLMKKANIDFAYILNSPLTDAQIGSKLKEIKKHINWVLNELNPDSLIITSFKIMKIVRKISNIPITISAIARIQKAKDIEKYLEINPSKLVVQHDVNRNFNDLKEILKFAKVNDIAIEIMLTESCRRRCPIMIDHYKTAGRGKVDTCFHRKCNIKKLESPEEFLLANFIRPEDVSFYEKLGIKYFKITGRSKSSSWLPLVVKAYLNRRFNGNLVRLLGIDPLLSAENWVYISNLALKGFLENFPKNENKEAEKKYCKKWIKKLYEKKDFYVKGVKYEILENEIIPKTNILDIPQIKKIYFNKKNENEL